PNGPRQRSFVQPSNTPLPLRSNCHLPVLGVNTPMRVSPIPAQFPTTGLSVEVPNGPRLASMLPRSSSPLPLISRNHFPVLGRKIPIPAVFILAFQYPATG